MVQHFCNTCLSGMTAPAGARQAWCVHCGHWMVQAIPAQKRPVNYARGCNDCRYMHTSYVPHCEVCKIGFWDMGVYVTRQPLPKPKSPKAPKIDLAKVPKGHVSNYQKLVKCAQQYGYEYGCIVPGCTRPPRLHHFIPRRAGGGNGLSNLIPICERHETPLHTAGAYARHGYKPKRKYYKKYGSGLETNLAAPMIVKLRKQAAKEEAEGCPSAKTPAQIFLAKPMLEP